MNYITKPVQVVMPRYLYWCCIAIIVTSIINAWLTMAIWAFGT